MQRTKVDRALEALEEQHMGDPERQEVVRRARRFKASWVELAEALTDARKKKSWQRWGYDSFEAYCKGELKLRAETVDKLTGSYAFLHKRAPEVLSRDPLEAPMPTYHAVDFLRRAEELAESDAPVEDATMEDLRRRVLEEGAPIATVSRLYKDTLFPVSEEERADRERKDIRSAAQKLREALTHSEAVPKKLAREVAEALARLLEDLEITNSAA